MIVPPGRTFEAPECPCGDMPFGAGFLLNAASLCCTTCTALAVAGASIALLVLGSRWLDATCFINSSTISLAQWAVAQGAVQLLALAVFFAFVDAGTVAASQDDYGDPWQPGSRDFSKATNRCTMFCPGPVSREMLCLQSPWPPMLRCWCGAPCSLGVTGASLRGRTARSFSAAPPSCTPAAQLS